MEYISTKEASAKWGISITRILILANEGRIPGAQRLGKSWLIPADAAKPPKRKASRQGSAVKEIDSFSFPLYHFRPDWSDAKKEQLSRQQQTLFLAETLHCHLMGIYYLRNNGPLVQKHGEAAVQIAYDTGFCFPLVTYYRFFSPVWSSVLAGYPKEFQEHCHEMISQYEKNYTGFISSISKHTVVTKLTDADFPYICSVLANSTNTVTADKLGVSPRTVKRKLARLCEKMGVNNKKELKEYLHDYM